MIDQEILATFEEFENCYGPEEVSIHIEFIDRVVASSSLSWRVAYIFTMMILNNKEYEDE